MELKTCKRCGEMWCFHGTGKPIRCGKCKSPYWDRERRDAEGDEGSGRQGTRRAGIPGIEVVRGQPGAVSQVVLSPRSGDREAHFRIVDEPTQSAHENRRTIAVPSDEGLVTLCAYTEYDTDTGETYRCGRPVHGAKVKHTRGAKL